MGSQPQTQETTTQTPIPKLSLHSLPHHLKPHNSTNFTSPLHTSASVPFSWEEHPGKPLPCLALTLPTTTIKCLDLPPRLLNDTTTKFSPTTVLDGPYNIGVKSYSFRFLTKRQGSFDSGESSPEKGLFGPVVLSRSSSSSRRYNKGVFGSWRKNNGHVIKNRDGICTSNDSTTSSNGGGTSIKVRKASFWAAMYGAFKQVIPKPKEKYKMEERCLVRTKE